MSSTIDITTRHHLIVEGASVCRLIALNRHRDRCRYAERPRLTGAEASWPRGKITSSRVYAAVSYELDHQYHDHTPPDGRDGVSLSRECSTSIPLRLSVTTCARLRAAATGLTDNNKIVGVFDDRPSSWTGRRIYHRMVPGQHQNAQTPASRPLQRAQKLRCALVAGPPFARRGRGGGPEHTWTASARSCASGMRFFSFGW